MGLISSTGRTITLALYDDIATYDIEAKNIIARLTNSICYLNIDGSKFLPELYDYFSNAFDIARFNFGKAVFSKKGRFGIIDLNGKVIVKPTYDGLRCFSKNISATKAGKCGFIDFKGNILLPFEFDEIEKLNQIGFLVEKNEFLGFLNNDLKLIIPVNFKVIKKFYSHYLLVSDGIKFGLYSFAGEEIIPLLYDRIQIFNNDCISLLNEGEVSYFFVDSGKYLKRK